MRAGFILLIFLACFGTAFASDGSMRLMIKPSEVSLPAGVAPGKYRRIIQPFNNWTLICDENLQEQTRVCNVTQTIVDQGGRTVFSWSLAATREGQPFMILRTLAELGPGGSLMLTLPDNSNPMRLSIEGCDANICLSRMPVGARLSQQIVEGGVIGISYETPSGQKVNLSAPLTGLNGAVEAIQ